VVRDELRQAAVAMRVMKAQVDRYVVAGNEFLFEPGLTVRSPPAPVKAAKLPSSRILLEICPQEFVLCANLWTSG
jgi:hypothetical protein